MTVPADEISPEVEPSETTMRGGFIRLLVILTALLALAMIALIYHRWLTVKEPNSLIVIQGNEQFEGAEITVNNANRSVSRKAIIDKKFNHISPIYLGPGVYELTIIKDGRTIFAQTFPIGEYDHLRLDLTQAGRMATTQPGAATRPAAVGAAVKNSTGR